MYKIYAIYINVVCDYIKIIRELNCTVRYITL